MYKTILRPIFFQFDPEKVHHFTFFMLKNFGFLTKLFFPKPIQDHRLEREVFGLKFKNPVGLAAGFDKNAVLFNELADLGFGFIEIGTVTPKPQTGNPKKRLFRLIEDGGIINRMGFNNEGLVKIVENLKKAPHKVIIGGNIGKNTNTLPENYTADYVECFEGLHDFVDYFADAATNQFNVSGATPSTIAYDPSSNAAGTTITLSDPNLSFQISGRPANGDSFTIETNVGGTKDGRNANALYALSTGKSLLGGTATLGYAYSQLVSSVGTQTNSAKINQEAQTALLEQATAEQQNLSGVNLDEEAANLLRYQQAYQACARAIGIAGTLFDDILSVMR